LARRAAAGARAARDHNVKNMQFYVFGDEQSLARREPDHPCHSTNARECIVVGHGPSNTAEARAKVLEKIHDRRRRRQDSWLILVRDACGFEMKDLQLIDDEVIIVNCDINDDVDAPFMPSEFWNIFLFYSLKQKSIAEKKGWETFACIPPTSTFFTGLCALLWCTAQKVTNVSCIGLDFNWDYVWAAHEQCRRQGVFASAVPEVAKINLQMSCVQILQAYIQVGVSLATNSPDFYKLLMQANEICADRDKLRDFFAQHQRCSELLVVEQAAFDDLAQLKLRASTLHMNERLTIASPEIAENPSSPQSLPPGSPASATGGDPE